jgi:hypothetical protein
MTLNELKLYVENLVQSGMDGNTRIVIRDSGYRFEDFCVNFDTVYIDEKNKLSSDGEKCLTCFWLIAD